MQPMLLMLNRFDCRPLKLSSRKFAILLLLLALFVRLGAVFALRDIDKFHGMQGGSDTVEFNTLGLRMASGEGYALKAGAPTSTRAPGFPFLLAGLYLISYANYRLVYLTFCLVGSLVCVLTYYLAKELLVENLARWAGLFTAVYFSHVYFSTIFLAEGLFTLCLKSFKRSKT